MDGRRFDRVTQALAAGVTRRRVLAGIFALAMTDGAADVAAAERGRRCQRVGVQCTRDGQCCTGLCRTAALPGRRRRQVCSCPTGEQACSGSCVDILTDPANCGACGNVCESGECIDGACPGPKDCSNVECPIDPGIGMDVCYVLVPNCEVVQGGAGNWAGGTGQPSIPCETDADCAGKCDLGKPECRCAWVEQDPGGVTSPGSPFCVNFDTAP
jgi:hypothetical protein